MKLTTLIVAVIVGFLFSHGSQAQDAKTKTFPLGKEFVADIAVCVSKESAVELANAHTKGGNEVAQAVFAIFSMMGECAIVTAPVTYIKLVHTSGKTNVYEVRIGGKPFFVATDWRHQEVRI